MRLLVAIPYFTPAWAYGGSVTVADALVRGLLEAGHEVTVATTDVLDERKRIPAGAPAEPEGAEVVRFPNVSHRLAATVAGYLPRGYRRWLRSNIHRFDVVLLQDVYTFVSVGAARAAERAGVPYALQPLGTLSPAAERGRPLAKRVFLELFANRTVQRASALLHSTEFERQDFLDVGARPEQLVKVPLPLELPDPNASVPRAERPTVVSVGRLHPIKGLDRLIQAHALVRGEVPDAQLIIAGPGDAYRKQLERVAADAGVDGSVSFPGFISQEEKIRLLRSAHASALLSASEGLPMAALEAMACGTPVVLSEGCHFVEADGRGGIVVTGDPQSAAKALVELLTNAERREELGAGAAELAQDYRAESVVPLMADVLGGIARAAGQPADSLRVLMLGTVNSPHVIDLREALRGRVDDVVVAGWRSPAFAAEVADAIVIPPRALPPIALVRRVRWLRSVVRRLSPDVVHVQGAGMFAVAATLANARPRLVTAFGTDVLSTRPLDRWRSRFVMRLADMATADSRMVVERLTQTGAASGRTFLVGWGVDLAEFAPGDAAEARRRLGLPADARLVLSPRAQAPIYNQDVIVTAFDQLADSRPDVHLVMKHLGGDQEPAHNSRHADRVHVIGHVPSARMPDIYRAADVVVSVPSSDSAPRTVWEAMACGAPCVLSDLPWLDGMVDPATEAEVVQIEPGAVAAGIARLLDDPVRAGAMAVKGRARVEREHNRQAHLERLLTLYRELAARRSNASA